MAAAVGAPPQTPVGAHAPRPLRNGVGGEAPPGSGAEPQRGSWGGAPSNFLAGEAAPGFGVEPQNRRPPPLATPAFRILSHDMQSTMFCG